MGSIRIRKSIKLPNGVKMNINKGSVSYTMTDENDNSVTVNPTHDTTTTNIKLGNGISYIDQKKNTKKKSNSKHKKTNDGNEITIG